MTSQALPNSDIWMVRAGESGAYIDYFLSEGLAAVGWAEVGPIEPADSGYDIKQRFDKVFPGDSNGRHQVTRFNREVMVGDAITTYDPKSRLYHVGVIESDVDITSRPVTHPERGEYQRAEYTRRVNWVYQVSRDSLSGSTRNSLSGLLTLFRLKALGSQELRQLCSEESGTVFNAGAFPVSLPESEVEDVLDTKDILQEYINKSGQFVEDAIAKLNWQEMQRLVAGILRAMGYSTKVSGPGPDRGVDIFASPDGLGLSEPRVFVEVKHRAGTIGSQAIRTFTGGRQDSDRCLYVSTGGFSKDARYEADRSRVPLTLLDITDLRELLLTHYENLDPETRTLVPLKKVYWPVSV